MFKWLNQWNLGLSKEEENQATWSQSQQSLPPFYITCPRMLPIWVAGMATPDKERSSIFVVLKLGCRLDSLKNSVKLSLFWSFRFSLSRGLQNITFSVLLPEDSKGPMSPWCPSAYPIPYLPATVGRFEMCACWLMEVDRNKSSKRDGALDPQECCSLWKFPACHRPPLETFP